MPDSDLSTQSKFFRGLADSARLSLLMALRDGPRPAGELAMACGLNPSNASNHLQCLLECGLVAVEAQGRQNVYALADPSITELLEVSRRIANGPAGWLIEACRSYGPPSRRKLRVMAATPPGRVSTAASAHIPAGRS